MVGLAMASIAGMSTPTASMAETTALVQSQSQTQSQLEEVSAPYLFGFVLQGYETRDLAMIHVAVDESVKATTFQNVETSLVQYQLIDSDGAVAASFYNQGYGTRDHLFLNVTAGTYTVRILNLTPDMVGGETYMNW
jgi:hypothetical protein